MTLPEWLCSPHTCYMAGWLYDFQTLIAGALAITAAVIAVGGQFAFHWYSEREAQRHKASTITLELIQFGAQIGLMLREIASCRDKGDWQYIGEISLPQTRKLIGQADEMLDSIRPWIPGPRSEVLVLLSWRTVNFRSVLIQTEAALSMVQQEVQNKTVRLKSNEPLLAFAKHLHDMPTAPLPAAMAGQVTRDMWKSE